MILNWNKKADESKWSYIYRIYSNQDLIGNNEFLGNLCRKELGEDFDESAYRKPYQYFSIIFEEIKDQIFDGTYLKELDDKMDLLYKQQVKTRDQSREKRKTLRDEARIETVVDAIKEHAESYPTINPVYSEELLAMKDGNEAILIIGDWHVGDCFDNFRNCYNEEILEQRVQELQNKTIAYCKTMNVSTLNVVNVGDMIAGNIHGSIRVETELDMVEQIKKSAVLVYQLLNYLSEHIPNVTYRSCLDNHSRMNKDYKEHIEKESFAYFTDWWLDAKLEDSRVKIIHDNLDPNIGMFTLKNGKNTFFVHGHRDQINTSIQNLTFGSNIICDILLMGHYHNDKMKSFQGKKVYVNGSLKGVDAFALNHRLFGDATQTLLVFDDKNTIDIRINL